MPSQRFKAQRQNRTPVGELLTLDAQFKRICAYIVDPLPVSRGYSYTQSMIDRFPVVVPIQNITEMTVPQNLMDH